MRALRRCVPLLAAAVALVAAGCGGDDGGGGGGDSSRPIRIGASLPLTGEFSEPGRAARQGYQVWQKLTNDRGGLLGRKVELIVRDDASDQNTVVADYNALISRQKVDLLLGTFSSLLNIPASTVAERNRMVYVEPAGGAPEIFDRGYKYLFFAQQATADKQGDLFAEYILNLPADRRPKTAAYPSLDDPFALPVVSGIREKFEQAGIRTVYRTTYASENTNFDAIVSRVKAANPDVLVHGAQFADGVGFARALDKVAFDPDWFFQTNAPSFADQYSEGIGAENTEGTFYAVSWTAEAKTPRNEEFLRVHRELFGPGEPAEDAADAFAAAQVLEAAVKAVGGIDDQKKLADWIRQNEVETILGTLRWDERGAPQGEFLIGQWQNGKSEIVLPEDVATTDTIVAPDSAAGAGGGGAAPPRPEVAPGVTELVQTILLGLLIGGVYALLASGLTLIFGVMNVINIAHGAFLVLAAFVAYSLWTWTGLDPLVSIAVTTPAMFAFGWLLYGGTIRRIRTSGPAASVLLTFSLALVLEGVMGLAWGNTSHAIRPSYFNESFGLGSLFLPKAQVYGCLVAVGVLIALYVFLARTWTGRAIRAAAVNPYGAQLVGVNVAAVATMTFAIGVATTGAGGSIVGVLYPFLPGSHYQWISRLLGIIVLGGMGSLPGAVVGALLIGVGETLTTTYVSPAWTTAVPYVVIFVVLLFRPQGLLGARLREDVAV